MATSFVQMDEGTDRKIRTFQRTDDGDTVEEWLQTDSEPILATYTICCTTPLTTATAASHLLQIMAGSTLRVGLRRLVVSQHANAGALAVCQFELRRLTTAGTGGTAITPTPLDPADSASGATAMTLPTAKGTEDVAVWVESGALTGSAALRRLLDLDFTKNRTKALWIAAGASNGIALKDVTGVATSTVVITAEIVEAGWA